MKSPASEAPNEQPREQLDRALAFARRAVRHWPAVPVMLIVGVAGFAVLRHFRPPVYRSEAVLVFSESVRISPEATAGTGTKNLPLRVQELLTARQAMQRVVEEFDLYPETRRQLGAVDAVDELKRHVQLRAPGGDTFTISFDGLTAEQAQGVTARLAELVIAQDSELRRKEARGSQEFLATEKNRAKNELGKAEESLAAFMAENPRFALDVNPLATGAAIRAAVGGPTTALAAPAPGTGIGSYVVLPPRPGAMAATAPAPAAPAIDPELARAQAAERARAEAAVAAARTDLSSKLGQFTDAHPDVRAARDAVRQAEARLAAVPGPGALARVTGPAPGPAPSATAGNGTSGTGAAPQRRVVRRIAPATPASKAARKAEEKDLVALETEWSRLTRAVTEARQRHDQVEAALFKAEIAASSASDTGATQMTIIDPAYLPERPVPPGQKTILAGFLALSLLLGAMVAFGLAAVDDRIYDRRCANGLGYVLVEVPKVARRRRAHV